MYILSEKSITPCFYADVSCLANIFLIHALHILKQMRFTIGILLKSLTIFFFFFNNSEAQNKRSVDSVQSDTTLLLWFQAISGMAVLYYVLSLELLRQNKVCFD